MEEYLTTEELSKRIKMAPGTIRNLVWKGELVKDVHYVKPTPRKLLFVWSSVQKWLEGDIMEKQEITHSDKKSLINI